MRNLRLSIPGLFAVAVLALGVARCGSGERPTFRARAVTPLAAGMTRVIVGFHAGGKAEVKSALQGMRGRIHHELDHLDAIAVTVAAGDVDRVRAHGKVAYVEEDAPRFAMGQSVPYGIDAVQARDVWDANRDGVIDSGAATGAGKLICIIDSGLHASHEDFAGVTVSGTNLPGTGDWNYDDCGHGTHVAGTIVAANNTLGVVGVSPGVALHIVKVFTGEACDWTYTSTLANALAACNAAGANIVSMSLGGGTQSQTEKKAMQSAYDAGRLLIAAAGNAGTTATSYPAGYTSVVSVAAVDSNNVVADFSQKNADVELAGPGVAVLSSVSFQENNSATVGGTTYAATHIEFSARGAATGDLVSGGLCDAVGAWSGKIVLCQRGTISFYDKVHNAELGGAAAAIIYNNVSGGFSGTLGDGNTSAIVGLAVSMEDGQAMLGQLGLSTTVSAERIVPANGYESWSGTSMATPHVSAVAALVWSKYPSLTNATIRNALTSTALDLGAAGRDTSYGYGLVRAKAAIDSLAGGGGGDTTPPVITNVTSVKTNARRGNFEIRWTTNEPSDSTVQFVGGSTYTNATLVTSHVMAFRGTKGATYQYYVKSKDAAGNEATAGPFTHVN